MLLSHLMGGVSHRMATLKTQTGKIVANDAAQDLSDLKLAQGSKYSMKALSFLYKR